MEMANAAGAAPKVSSGKVYMLTLKAATAKMLSEIPAAAHPGEVAHGWAAVARETTPAARHTRKRAARGAPPRVAKSQGEPAAEEAAAARKYRRNPDVPGSLLEREAVHVHHVLRGPEEPEEVAHHAQRVGRGKHPKAAVAQHGRIGHARLRRPGRGRRAARHPEPERNPGEPEHTRHHERMAPSAAQRDPGGQQRRDHRAQADAGLIDRVAERSLAGAQVLVDRLSGRGNAGRFGHPEDRAATHESTQSASQAGGDAGARPDPDGETDRAVQPDPVDQQSGQRRAGRVGQTEGAADQTVLRVGKVELVSQHRRQGGERGAVQVVDGGGEHEYRQHQPAVARSVVDLSAGLVHWNCHWNSMVATSPAVASRALAFGKYSTVILRGFCAPQPSDTSPLPVYTTFDGSATSNFTSLCAASSMERRACCLGRQSTCFSVPLTLPSGFGPSHHGTGLSPPTGVPSLYLASAL